MVDKDVPVVATLTVRSQGLAPYRQYRRCADTLALLGLVFSLLAQVARAACLPYTRSDASFQVIPKRKRYWRVSSTEEGQTTRKIFSQGSVSISSVFLITEDHHRLHSEESDLDHLTISNMHTIPLGSLGLTVSKLGYGCMGLTSFYGTKLPDPEIIQIMEKVSESGITFIDTANLYCYLDTSDPDHPKTVCQEEILGKAVEKIGRDKVVIATKTAIDLELHPQLKFEVNGQPSFIRAQCEASLRRFGVDCIDLFYLHRIDQTLPIEVSMYEMKKLVEEGKVKYIGLSECSAETIRRAHKIHPITAIQMEYSLWCRGIEKDVLPTCKELGIGLVAYSPLGRGFFGGSHKTEMEKTDFRQHQERFKSDKNHQMYEELTKFAESKGVTAAQLALAWVEAQQDRAAGVVAIPGTTKEKNLLSNVESLDIQLSKEDLETIEKIVPWEETEGGRYEGRSGASTWEEDNNPALTAELAEKWGVPFES